MHKEQEQTAGDQLELGKGGACSAYAERGVSGRCSPGPVAALCTAKPVAVAGQGARLAVWASSKWVISTVEPNLQFQPDRDAGQQHRPSPARPRIKPESLRAPEPIACLSKEPSQSPRSTEGFTPAHLTMEPDQ